MKKINSLFADLQEAQKRLEETQGFPSDLAHQDATIQRFEFTFELSWKTMQTLAKENGIEAFGPRNSIRAAAQLKLIDDPQEWFVFLDYRNKTTHLYKADIAKEVFAHIPKFIPLLNNFVSKAQTQIKGL